MALVYRRQRPIKGGRQPLPACVLKDIHHAVEADAMKYGVSKSFVIAVILAKAYRIDEQEPLEAYRDRGGKQKALPTRLASTATVTTTH